MDSWLASLLTDGRGEHKLSNVSKNKPSKAVPTRKVGRPTKYDPKYCEEIIKYFDIQPYKTVQVVTTGKNDYEKIEEKEVPNDLRFIRGFANHIGVTQASIFEWSEKYPEFSIALKEAKELQREFMLQNGLRGLYASAPFIFAMKNMHGWRDEVPAPQELHLHFMNVLQQIRAIDENRSSIQPRKTLSDTLREIPA